MREIHENTMNKRFMHSIYLISELAKGERVGLDVWTLTWVMFLEILIYDRKYFFLSIFCTIALIIY